MRILGIGWRNLASLPVGPEVGEGEEPMLWLDRPPLSQVGLFVISGPTGSGKSTILDAMCLALFDRTPRIADSGRVKTGRIGDAEEARLTDSDTRNLLRRGAADGEATCVFAGKDGLRWRARWSVRRARRKADGRYQAVEMELREEGSELPVGRGKQETLSLIQERLGLDFDQFRRSVLLAQGEFAAFLRAGEKERADLLEKVTGTSVYARLGRAAFVRANEARDALAVARQEEEALGLLSEEERTALAARRAASGVEAEAAERTLHTAGDALAWDDRRREAESALAQAEEAAVEAAAAEGALAPQREEVGLLRAAQPLARLMEAAGAARVRANIAARRGHEAETEVADKSRTLVEAQSRVRLAARRAASDATSAWQAAVRAQAAATAEAQAASARRDAKEGDRGLLLAWPAAQGALATLAQRVASRPAAAAAREGLRRDEELAEGAAGACKTEGEAALVVAAQARAAAAAARAALRAQPRDELEARRREATAALRVLAELGRGAAAITEAEATLAALLQVEAVATAGAREHRARAEAAETAAQEQGLPIPTLERALDRATLAAGLETQRALLDPGEPCPLCGAADHPYAIHSPRTEGALGSLRKDLTTLREQVTLRRSEATKAHAESAEQARRALDARARAEEGAAWIAETGRDWTREFDRLPPWLHAGLEAEAEGAPGASPDDPSPRIDLAPRVALATARLQAVETATEILAIEASRADRLDDDAEAARSRVDAARAAADGADRNLLGVRRAVQAFDEAEARGARLHAAALGSLSALLGLPEVESQALAEAPTAWLAALRDRVDELRAADAAFGASQTRCGAAEVALGAARDHQERANQELLAVSARWGAPSDVEAAATAVVSLREALQDEERAVGAMKQAAGRAAAAAESAATGEEEAQRGTQALSEALTSAGIEEATLRARVSALPTLPGLEDQLASARIVAERAAAACGVHAQSLAALRADPRSALPAATAWEQLESLGGAPTHDRAALTTAAGRSVRELHEQHGRLREQIDADDRARVAAATLGPRIETLAVEDRRWATLRDLIGDAEGSKFKRFAQSLTLDLLLAHANQHLQELKPRYALERVPDSRGLALLEMQVVDRDMGNEIRPVSSVSGGESFLISLALALSLSSLSSEGNAVGSLFIDEGFGTLDADTLGVALAALEGLQAGGRQVGVISHVRELAEYGLQVQVTVVGPGRSRVRVVGPGTV